MLTAISRRVFALVLTALAVVLIAACGSSKKSDAPTNAAAADPAAIVPAGTPVYVEATVKPSANQKAAFSSLSEAILKVPDPSSKLIALIDKSGAKNGVTYEDDIKPWLGDKAAVVVTRVAAANRSAFAVIIDTTDPKKAMAAIEKGNPDLKTGTTHGVSYEIAADRQSWAGTMGDYLVIGNPAGFTAVATAQGDGRKLTDRPQFVAARAKAPADRLAYLYLDTDALLNFAATTNATLKSQAGTFKGLFGNTKALSASLVATPTAIEIDASIVGAKGSTPATGVSALPLGKAPGDAWAALSIRNVGPTLTKTLASLGKIGAATNGQNFDQILAQLKTATGLDVQQDLLSWMGDASAFVSGSSLADLNAAVVIKSTDPAKSQAAIGKIADFVTRIGRTADPIDVPGGGKGIEIATSSTGPKVEFAASGDLFVIAIGKDAIADALHPATTLDSTPTYQAAVASLKGATPALYVNVQTVVSYAEALAAGNAKLDAAKPYLDAFTSLIAGGTSSSAKIVLNVK